MASYRIGPFIEAIPKNKTNKKRYKTMICPECKATIPDTVKFCPKCGAEVKMASANDIITKICPTCGTEYPVTAKFCKKDGTPLLEKGTRVSVVRRKKAVRTSNLQGWIVAFLMVLSLSGVVGYLLLSGKISENSTDNTSVTEKKEEKKSYGLMAVINDPDGYTYIRSGPGTQYEIIGTVVENEVFYVISTEGNWWRIRTKDGKEGYMHKSRIRILK
jgi:ribosomal protein L40E